MKRSLHFSPSSEGGRDLRLALLWISALLVLGAAANVVAALASAAQ